MKRLTKIIAIILALAAIITIAACSSAPETNEEETTMNTNDAECGGRVDYSDPSAIMTHGASGRATFIPVLPKNSKPAAAR